MNVSMAKLSIRTLFSIAIIVFAPSALGVTSTTVTFDNGDNEGFGGNAFFENSGGNPDGNAHHFVNAFGIALRTGGLDDPINENFIGDYTAFSSITISFDVMVNTISSIFSGEVPRQIGISLIDNDAQGPSGSAGVFFEAGVISAATHSDWTTLSVTIDNPNSLTLPPGAIGFGDEDPNTFEPILPNGLTFADVLGGVDEFQITTFVPGFFFTFNDYDVRIDNITLEASPVPVPGAVWLFGSGVIALLGIRRRQ